MNRDPASRPGPDHEIESAAPQAAHPENKPQGPLGPPAPDDPRLQRRLRALDRLGWTLLVLYVGATIWIWSDRFWDPWLQNDDVRITFFPFWSFRSPLFDSDYLAEAMLAFVPPIYRAIVYAQLYAVDLLTVPKILQVLTLVWTAFHASRIGYRRAGSLGALLLVYLTLHSLPILSRTSGGLPRAFAFPAIMLLLDAMDRRSERVAGLGPIVGAAFYPPAGFLASLTYGFWMLGRIWRVRGERRRLIRSTATLAVVAILTLLVAIPSMRPRPEYGRIHTYAEAQTLPEFGQYGRLGVVPLDTLELSLRRLSHQISLPSADGPPGWVLRWSSRSGLRPFHLIAAGVVIFYLTRRSRLPPGPVLLGAAGFFGFFLAQALAFRLYSPERMLLFSLPAAAVVFLGVGFTDFGWKSGNPLRPRIASLAGFFLFAATMGMVHPGPPGVDVDAAPQRPLFEVLHKMPPDVLLAGHPRRMNNIPLWGRRPVLINVETAQPWLTLMWEEIRGRLYDNLDAYYATELEPVRGLRERYGVDYMLVHEGDLAPDYAEHCQVFEPFTSHLRELCAAPADSLIWNRIDPSAILAKEAGFYVIDLERVLEEDATPGADL